MRTHLRLMAAACALFGAQAVFQAQQPPAQSAGIYLRGSDGSGQEHLVPLKGILVTDMRQKGLLKVMLSQGHAKGSIEGVIKGATASVRVPNGNAAFQFTFDETAAAASDKPNPNDPNQMQHMQQMMGLVTGNGMPYGATNAAEFALVPLKVNKGERSIELGNGNGPNGSSLPKETVPISADAIAAHVFKVQPKQPLAPGEYAFCWVAKGFGGQIWDFGVDGK